MKRIWIVILICLTVNLINAQPPGGGGPPRDGMSSGRPEMPVFDAQKSMGIMSYDTHEVLIKVKIREVSKRQRAGEIFYNYSRAMDKLYFANKVELDALEKEVRSKRQMAAKSRDQSSMQNMNQMIDRRMSAIKQEARKLDEKLNLHLLDILSKKQLKKWNKYQRKQKEALVPTMPSQNGGNRPNGGGPPGMQ